MLVASDVSLQVLQSLKSVVPAIAVKDAEVADQLKRAATSVHLNLAEGARRSGNDQRRFYRIASGSAAEVKAALEIAYTWNLIPEQPKLMETLDRLLGLLWGLANGPKPKPE